MRKIEHRVHDPRGTGPLSQSLFKWKVGVDPMANAGARKTFMSLLHEALTDML